MFVDLEDVDISSEFSLSSSKLTALVCYTKLEGAGLMLLPWLCDNTVQAFTTDVSQLTLIHTQTIVLYSICTPHVMVCQIFRASEATG